MGRQSAHALGGVSAEPQSPPPILPLQAYKPFHQQTAQSTRTTGGAQRCISNLPPAPEWRHLAQKRGFVGPRGLSGSSRVGPTSFAPTDHGWKGTTSFAPTDQGWKGNPVGWNSAAVLPRMSLHQRVSLAETQSFLRAKLAAKEQLCSQVIGENQQLLRQLEETQAKHRQAVERIKAEAASVVQHLLADTAVYRDTHENLLKKLELQERQATNESLRARHAERHRQETEEKLLVLKRFVAGLQEKQKRLEEEAHAFTNAFRTIKSAIQTFAANLAACNFSEDDKAVLEQLPEMVALGINRMQLVLSDTESRLLEEGFVKEVSAKAILNSTDAKPETMMPASEATRLQRERKMWENKFVRTEKELRAKEKEVEELKKDNTRKADVLVKLRLKDHRLKQQDAEFSAARAKANELQAQLEKLRKERDDLAAWKASHPLYKGYRWDREGTKPRSVNRSPSRADPAANKSQGLVATTLKLLQPRETPKSPRDSHMARSVSRASISSNRRISSVPSATVAKQKPSTSLVMQHLDMKRAVSSSPPKGKTASSPGLLLAAKKTPTGPKANVSPRNFVALSPRASRLSLEGMGMTTLRRRSQEPADADAPEKKPPEKKTLALQSESVSPQPARSRHMASLGEAKVPSRKPSIGEGYHHLTLTLPSPRAVTTPVLGAESPVGTGAPIKAVEAPGDPGRLAAFFSSAFSKAAEKEKEGRRLPQQRTQQEVEAESPSRLGRSDRKASSGKIRMGSIASLKALAFGGRRVHIGLQPAEDEGLSERDNETQPLSPRSQIARSQAIAFMEGGTPHTARRGGAAHTVHGPRLSRAGSFGSAVSVRTLRTPSATILAAATTANPSAALGTAATGTAPAGTAMALTSSLEEVTKASPQTSAPWQQKPPRKLRGVGFERDLDQGNLGAGKNVGPPSTKQGSSFAVNVRQAEGHTASSSGPFLPGPRMGAPREGATQKFREGTKGPVGGSQPSRPAEGAVLPKGDKVADEASGDVEGLLQKYLGGKTEIESGAPKPDRKREGGDQQAANTAGQGHHTAEEERKPRRMQSQQNTQEALGVTPKRTTPAGLPAEPGKRDLPEGPHLVALSEDTGTLKTEQNVDKDTQQQQIVRIGTRTHGGTFQVIAGVKKAPPKRMEQSRWTDNETERPETRDQESGASASPPSAAELKTAPALLTAPAPTPASAPTPAHSSAGGLLTDLAAAKASAGVPLLGPPDGVAGGQHRKRASVSDINAGSWAMATPKMNISAVKVSKHESQGKEET